MDFPAADRDTAPAPDEAPAPVTRDGLLFPLGARTPAHGEMIEVAPGIRWGRLPIFGPLAHVNVLAVDDGDGQVAIVDTGFNTDEGRAGWDGMLAGALAGRSVSRVICTHMHPDHVGLAGWLCDRFGVDLWMTRGEWLTIRMLASDARDEVPPEQVAFWRGMGWSQLRIANASEGGFGRMRRALAPLPLGYRRVEHGDTMTIAGRPWEVVVGSGHSPEHACLLDRAGRVLIAGDQVLPRISSNVSLGVTEPMADPLGEWLASLARLRTLPDDVLVIPGHGEPFHGLHARCVALEDEHADRLDKLEAFLRRDPARAVDCFGQLFRRPIEDDHLLGMASGEAMAHLRRLEVTGRATRETVDGVWWWHAR